MISFRYHLVSIVAVFLALALGIVVGTTALNGPITKDLRGQVDGLKKQRDTLAAQNKSLRGQVDDAGQFAATYGTKLVGGTLQHTKVLLVSMPGASSDEQTGVARQLQAAGGTVTGRLSLTSSYLDASRAGGIVSLATGAAKPVGLQLPVTSDGGQIGGALLSYVLLGRGQGSDLTQVLGSLSGLHMLTLDGNIAPATSVVVLTRGTLSASSYGSAAELALVNALAKSGGHVVVAGDSASASGGGLVAQVRQDSSAQKAVSSVDDADSAFGQVSAVLALSGADNGTIGHYGAQRGADTLFPSPAK